jgi:hypothetical protein
MTAPGICSQGGEVFDHTGSNRIEMDIPCEFQKVRVILTDNGLVAILKHVTVAFVPSIEVDHVTGKNLPHTISKAMIAAPDQEVKVVRHKGPCVAYQTSFLTHRRQPIEKILPILLDSKYLVSLDAPAHDVVEGPRSI